jgi:uncharacterized pyridoxal phosphate-containing UPF0001 family protein
MRIEHNVAQVIDRIAARMFDPIHSVDSVRLAQELEKRQTALGN